MRDQRAAACAASRGSPRTKTNSHERVFSCRGFGPGGNRSVVSERHLSLANHSNSPFLLELAGVRGSFRADKPEPPAIVSRSVQIAFGAARAANGQAVLPEPDPGEPVLVRNFPFAHQAVQRHAVCATGFEVFHRTSVTAWIRQTGLTFLTSSAKSSPFLCPLSGPLGISWHCRPFHGVSRPGEARRLHRFTHQNGRTTKLVFSSSRQFPVERMGDFPFASHADLCDESKWDLGC